jgi:hypothetical protein
MHVQCVCLAFLSGRSDLMVYNHEIDFQKGRQTVKMGRHEIAGVLWKSVLLCCAFLTAHCSKFNGGFSWVVIPLGPIGTDILLPAPCPA